jgi:hypothetical protein
MEVDLTTCAIDVMTATAIYATKGRLDVNIIPQAA